MRKIALAMIAAATLLSGVSAQAGERRDPEERLARLLEGRVAGEPRSCLNQWDTRDMQVIDHTAIVFRSGRTLWVNRPDNAEDLDDDDVMVTRTNGSQLCNLDIVRTFDRTAMFPNGFINLGDFVPYRRAETASRD